jgi:hypothetical protein
MKKYATIIFLLSAIYGSSAQVFKDFSAQMVLGVKLHTDNYEGPNIDEAWQLKSSMLLGFEGSYRKWPRLSFSYLHDFTFFLVNPVRSNPISTEITNLHSSAKGNFLSIYYRRNRFKYGLGHYSSLHEDIVNYIFPNGFLKQHIAFSVSFVSRKAEFEFVKLYQYKKNPSLFAIDNQYFTIKYKIFGKKQGFYTITPKENTRTTLTFKTGIRGFAVRNTHLLGEHKDRFGTSFLAGIELTFNKINTSLFAERDWWLRLNGGSPYRDVKGYVVNSVVGLKYAAPRLKGAFVSFGYDWTTDYNTIYETWDKIKTGEAAVDLFYYNVKGLAVGIGFPVSQKFDIDLRGILPIRGEKGFNPMRYSLGMIYKIKP